MTNLTHSADHSVSGQEPGGSCFITEAWLRQRFGLGHGTEVHLPAACKLTPSAKQLLDERQIRIKVIDEQGRFFIGDGDSPQVQVHPLKSNNVRPETNCALCHQPLETKPEVLTHLDDTHLVLKNHPRIKLRGKLDTLSCYCVLVQAEFDQTKQFPLLHQYLADIRSYIGNILRSEVTEEPLLPISMGDLDDPTIHAISHQPLKYIGHDHILPDAEHGRDVAQLNVLRAMARECELLATDIYLINTFEITRNDLIQGLNRLSSAIYVVALLALVGKRDGLGALSKVGGNETT
ncbi:Uncharacterised protein [BD1-7 clade bacterium]|uniref:Cobalamin adenosyltransferase-like domain-containing protein n=1 Tax=BD1-7 clade bacterium TaxID=2029982 RepID=A0A5S9QF94_9GAMM|nr:Uncharacterised protein [BD1-7 clade bacterium]CAA0117153.1 Uncharacterised protein [BD1-7 clade bacterium]